MKLTIKKNAGFAESREAVFSVCEKYRYSLRITWDLLTKPIQFIGLNPSTADEMQDDPTVRRCIRFARRFGGGGLIMTNIFAFRSTDPKKMIEHPMPVGEFQGICVNNHILLTEAQKSSLVIAAWGVHGVLMERGKHVAALIGPKKLVCLGLTQDGFPKHPLYLRKDTEPKPFWPF